MADIFIGNIKGPQGDTGATGPQGEKGDAATIRVGSVTTTQYGQTARVTNSGTENDAVFDFVIPQGRPGEQVTRIDNLQLDALTEPSASFPVPAVGDNGSTLFGKISKWFSDMAALVATKLNASNVVNNLTTTSSGYALDARQGKALSDMVGSLFTVYDRQIHLNRISSAGIKEVRCTLTDGRHLAIIYCGFKTETAISSQSAIITGFSPALGLFNTIINGFRADTMAPTHFYINPAGSICLVEALPAGVWCQCSGVYITNG